MTIETLTNPTHVGLAGIDSARLKQMRDKNLQACFSHFEEMHYHREFVARIYGKTFVNDAASCSINATWYTLESAEGPVIWIANGDGRKTDYGKLVNVARNKVKMLICLGNDNDNLHKSFENVVPTIIDAATLDVAVSKALYNNLQTATVIFSPACDTGMAISAQGESFSHEVNEL